MGGKLDPLWNRPLTGLDQALNAVVAFLKLYQDENGDAEKVLAWVQTGDINRIEVNEGVLVLLEIYQKGGQPAVAAVVREMTRRSDQLQELPYDAFPNWIRSAGTAQ